MSSVSLVIDPRPSDLGDGFFVRRALPYMKKRMIGPFIFWDHMGPASFDQDHEMKVRAHPHIGLATITYLFKGEIMHRDSIGSKQMIRPGEINWMTAGSGIAHSERVQHLQGKMELEGIQVWVALPKEYEEVDPSFDHYKEKDLPSVEVDGANYRLIVGSAFGKTSPVKSYSEMFYLSGHVKAGQKFNMPVRPNHEGGVYVVSGEIEIEGVTYSEAQMIAFNPGAEINFTAKGEAVTMILGGEIFPEKRFIWWNFVSSSHERIEQAKRDWKSGKFDKVIDEEEIIPLPADKI